MDELLMYAGGGEGGVVPGSVERAEVGRQVGALSSAAAREMLCRFFVARVMLGYGVCAHVRRNC